MSVVYHGSLKLQLAEKSLVFASMSLFTCLLKFYHVGGHTNEVVEARTRLTCPLAVIWTTVKACRKNNNNDDAYYYYFLSRRKKENDTTNISFSHAMSTYSLPEHKQP